LEYICSTSHDFLIYNKRRQQAAGSRQQAAGSRQQAAGSRQQAAGSRQHKEGYSIRKGKVSTANCILPAAYSLFRAIVCAARYLMAALW
jgi:uncharacterized protein YjbJ (UPF0337 family)